MVDDSSKPKNPLQSLTYWGILMLSANSGLLIFLLRPYSRIWAISLALWLIGIIFAIVGRSVAKRPISWRSWYVDPRSPLEIRHDTEPENWRNRK